MNLLRRVEPDDVAAPAGPRTDRLFGAPARWPWLKQAAAVGAVVALVVGVALRFVVRGGLWLDEALTVNIAHLRLTEIPRALAHDGAPPLYYVALHGWMRVFGTGDFAVRSLSIVFALAALAVGTIAARRVFGKAATWPVLLVLATNPFAIRYATEARMYALITLEVAAGIIVLHAALTSERRGPLVGVALVSAALLYTHYWAIYLLGMTGIALIVLAWRDAGRRPYAKRAIAAIVGGGVLWLPWLPVFVHQSLHTGTPWANPASIAAELDLPGEFAGTSGDVVKVLGLVLVLLFLLGLFMRRSTPGHIVLAKPRPRNAVLGAIAAGTPLLALLGGQIGHAAFAARYAAVVLVPFVILVALGTMAFATKQARAVVLAVVCVLGVVAGAKAATQRRTEAPRLAAALRTFGAPGDVVVYCPDQLSPAMHRIIGGEKFTEMAFPRGGDPAFVNWTDYSEVYEDADPFQFAAAADAAAGPDHSVFLVMNPRYHGTIEPCLDLQGALWQLRPHGRTLVNANGRFYENAYLVQLRPAALGRAS